MVPVLPGKKIRKESELDTKGSDKSQDFWTEWRFHCHISVTFGLVFKSIFDRTNIFPWKSNQRSQKSSNSAIVSQSFIVKENFKDKNYVTG